MTFKVYSLENSEFGEVYTKAGINGEDHGWAGYGNSNPKFTQALDFTSDFLFHLLPCNNTTDITEFQEEERQLIKIIDILGRSSDVITNSPLFYIYSDGSVEHKIIIN